MLQPRTWLLVSMILFPVVLRLVDHPWNMAPVGALALFVGAHFRHKSWAFIVPLCALFISDLALGIKNGDLASYTFHSLVPLIYGCFALYVCLGLGVRRVWDSPILSKREPNRADGFADGLLRILPVAGATMTGAVLFYLITNLGWWAASDHYPKTAAGLIQCYVAGVAFFRSTLVGDVFCVTLLFGGYALLKHRLPTTVQAALHVSSV